MSFSPGLVTPPGTTTWLVYTEYREMEWTGWVGSGRMKWGADILLGCESGGCGWGKDHVIEDPSPGACWYRY